MTSQPHELCLPKEHGPSGFTATVHMGQDQRKFTPVDLQPDSLSLALQNYFCSQLIT